MAIIYLAQYPVFPGALTQRFDGVHLFAGYQGARSLAALPLDNILTLAGVHLYLFGSPRHSSHSHDLIVQQFWLRLLPNWPLLRRLHLAPVALRGPIKALREDCKNPLLPSLTELALAETTLYEHEKLCLRDALMKRMEQGVPLKTLDLRMCRRDSYNLVAVQCSAKSQSTSFVP